MARETVSQIDLEPGQTVVGMTTFRNVVYVATSDGRIFRLTDNSDGCLNLEPLRLRFIEDDAVPKVQS